MMKKIKKLEGRAKNFDFTKTQDKSPKPSRSLNSINEMPVDLLDQELNRWIKVIKPPRSSLTYERYE